MEQCFIMRKGSKCVTNSITCYCDSHAISLQLSYPVRSFLVVKSTNFQEIKKVDVSECPNILTNQQMVISEQLCRKIKLRGKRTCYTFRCL